MYADRGDWLWRQFHPLRAFRGGGRRVVGPRAGGPVAGWAAGRVAGIRHTGAQWMVYHDYWDAGSMASVVSGSEVPLVGSALTVVMVYLPGLSKNRICKWVKQLVDVVATAGGTCMAFATVVPVEGSEKRNIKNFNCNLVSVVRKLQVSSVAAGVQVVVLPVHQFALKSQIHVADHQQLSARQGSAIVQALLIMLRHEFLGLAALYM